MTATPPSRLTVLLANEQETWHRQVRDLLAPQGVRTVSAITGREALGKIEDACKSGDPDGRLHAAVLDTEMKSLNGLQVAKLARDLPGAPPVILMAPDGSVTAHILTEALTLRVFSVLPKPVELNLLLDSLARLVARHYAGKWPGSQN